MDSKEVTKKCWHTVYTNFLVQYIPLYRAPEVNAFIYQAVFYDFLSNPCDPFTFVPIYTHHKCYLPKTLPIWSQLTDIYASKNSYQKHLS